MKRWICVLLALSLCLSLCACSSSDYKEAETYFSQGKYDAAIPIYEALGDYQDSADKLMECHYQKALKLMEKADYEGALSAFASLGDYRDSAEMIGECQYQQALLLMADGDYAGASALLEQLGDYKDSADQARECQFRLAQTEYQNGLVKEAVARLSRIFDYPGANSCLYQILLDELTANYLSHLTDAGKYYDNYTKTWTRQLKTIADRTPAGQTFDLPPVDEQDPDIVAMGRCMAQAEEYLEELHGIFSEEVLARCQDESLNHFFEVLDSSHEEFVKYYNPKVFFSRFSLILFYSSTGQSSSSLIADFNNACYAMMDAAKELGGTIAVGGVQ